MEILILIYIFGVLVASMCYLLFDSDWSIFTPLLSWIYVIGLASRIYFDNKN